eukprot:ANDGO_05895.mRNA.1 hypothetical protein
MASIEAKADSRKYVRIKRRRDDDPEELVMLVKRPRLSALMSSVSLGGDSESHRKSAVGGRGILLKRVRTDLCDATASLMLPEMHIHNDSTTSGPNGSSNADANVHGVKRGETGSYASNLSTTRKIKVEGSSSSAGCAPSVRETDAAGMRGKGTVQLDDKDLFRNYMSMRRQAREERHSQVVAASQQPMQQEQKQEREYQRESRGETMQVDQTGWVYDVYEVSAMATAMTAGAQHDDAVLGSGEKIKVVHVDKLPFDLGVEFLLEGEGDSEDDDNVYGGDDDELKQASDYGSTEDEGDDDESDGDGDGDHAQRGGRRGRHLYSSDDDNEWDKDDDSDEYERDIDPRLTVHGVDDDGDEEYGY